LSFSCPAESRMTSRIEEAFVLVSSTSHRLGPLSQIWRASLSGSPRIRRKTQAPNNRLYQLCERRTPMLQLRPLDQTVPIFQQLITEASPIIACECVSSRGG